MDASPTESLYSQEDHTLTHPSKGSPRFEPELELDTNLRAGDGSGVGGQGRDRNNVSSFKMPWEEWLHGTVDTGTSRCPAFGLGLLVPQHREVVPISQTGKLMPHGAITLGKWDVEPGLWDAKAFPLQPLSHSLQKPSAHGVLILAPPKAVGGI